MSRSVAVVTGASRGIGRATAIRLARDFSAIVVVARNAETLEDTAAKVRAAGAEPLALALDLREPASADAVVKQTLDRHHRIDALINVAGAVPQTDLLAMTDAEWDDGLSLKFHGARRLTIKAWEALKNARGAIVLTSGATALAPKPALAAVATINAAIAALAKAFSERGIADGVQVNSVLPGPVVTDRRRSMLARYAAAQKLSLDEAMQHFAAEAGISRYGQPEEIADLMAFLVSPAARWMTGTAVRYFHSLQAFGAMSLGPIEQQIVLMVVSRANKANYSLAIHAALATKLGASPEVVKAVGTGGPVADPKIDALRRFTERLTVARGQGHFLQQATIAQRSLPWPSGCDQGLR
jgi:3-oxoacyl-[acyl-carrier protein] reductase